MRTSKFSYDKNRKLYQPQITEEHVVIEIIMRLWWNKIKVYRIRERIPGLSRSLSTPGIPDLIGWYKRGVSFGPIPVFIEVKRPKDAERRAGVRRLAQTQFIEQAAQDGCIAFFAESFDDCIREFQKFGITLRGA